MAQVRFDVSALGQSPDEEHFFLSWSTSDRSISTCASVCKGSSSDAQNPPRQIVFVIDTCTPRYWHTIYQIVPITRYDVKSFAEVSDCSILDLLLKTRCGSKIAAQRLEGDGRPAGTSRTVTTYFADSEIATSGTTWFFSRVSSESRWGVDEEESRVGNLG